MATRLVPVALLLSAFWPAVVRGDLIVNGSFEMPAIPNGTEMSNVTSVPGWTVFGGTGIQIFNTNYHESGSLNGGYNDVFNAENGVQSIDVSGTSNVPGQGLLQQVVTTTTGQEYALSFYVGKADGLDPVSAIIDVSIDGGPPIPYTNFNTTPGGINWENFVLDFTATGTSTTVAFTYGTAPPNYVAGLDNVTLNAVPEPSALVLSTGLLGALGLAWWWQRGRQRAHAL
jgi:hypothetical protein